MAKIYTLATTGEPVKLLARAIKDHANLHKSKIQIAVRFVANDPGKPELVEHGQPVGARIRVVKLADRSIVPWDAVIDVAARIWSNLDPRQRLGLLDHQLAHLVVPEDERGKPKLDTDGRPILRNRNHDWNLGGFREVVQRHGPASPEARQVAVLYETDGQALFPWVADAAASRPDDEPPKLRAAR